MKWNFIYKNAKWIMIFMLISQKVESYFSHIFRIILNILKIKYFNSVLLSNGQFTISINWSWEKTVLELIVARTAWGYESLS